MIADTEGDPSQRPLLFEDSNEESAAEQLSNSSTNSGGGSSSSLSGPLLVLFAITGVTLSFPMTAVMYIVNTRVAVPLSILPTYAALSYLPFSLKPLYAYLSSSSNSTTCGLRWRRDWLIAALMLLGSVLTALMAWLPPRGDGASSASSVMILIILSFARSLFSAWPEFLLGLTLLDQAVVAATASAGGVSSLSSVTAEKATVFQSQAATAIYVGCFMASALVLLWMLAAQQHQQYSHDTHTTTFTNTVGSGESVLNDRLVTQLLVTTSAFHWLGAAVAVWYQVGVVKQQEQNQQLPIGTDSNIDNNESCGNNEETTQPGASNMMPRVSSYGSCQLDDYNDVEQVPATAATMHQENEYQQDQQQPLISTNGVVEAGEEDDDDNDESSSSSSFGASNSRSRSLSCGIHPTTRLVILLQTTILLLSLQTPIINATGSRMVWNLSITAAVTSLVLSVVLAASSVTSWSMFLKQPWLVLLQQHSPDRSYRVGLFLILRQAVVPNVSYLMSSYLYGVFAVQAPAFLAVLSLWDMATGVVGSWSYGILFAGITTTTTDDAVSTPPTNNAGAASTDTTHQASAASGGRWFGFGRGIFGGCCCCCCPTFDYVKKQPILLWLIVGTTMLSSLTYWLGNTALFHMWRSYTSSSSSSSSSSGVTTVSIYASTLVIKLLLSVTSEWQFLPDLVVATTTAMTNDEEAEEERNSHGVALAPQPPAMSLASSTSSHDSWNARAPMDPNDTSTNNSNTNSNNNNHVVVHAATTATATATATDEIGMRYGIMVSCIDFGGQLGALVVGCLVAIFGTSRENDWEHMDGLLQVSAACMCLSAGLVVLLR